MSAGAYNGFIIEQGATFNELLTYEDPDGTPINLSSYTSAEMQIRTEPNAGELVFTFKTSPAADEGTITLGGSAGTVQLSASGALTADLEPGGYWYDLFLYSAADNERLIAGGLKIVERITIP